MFALSMNPWNEAPLNGSSGRRPKNSITNKVSSFLSRSSTHINNFTIELEEPLRQHGPGDTVKGTVILNVAKPLGVTHIVACLYGYVQVYKNHSKPSAIPRANTNRTVSGQNKRWVSEYYGDGFASLFEEEVVLCGEGRLDPKSYHFRFAIEFPTDMALPSSIDFERGTIHYMVWSTITRPNPIISTTSCEAKVLFRDHLDVAGLLPPKPREVTLRAVEPGSKSRNGLRRLASAEKNRGSHASSISRTNRSTRTFELKEGVPTSRNASISNPSSRSSSSSRNRVASLASGLRSSQNSTSPRRVDLDNDFPHRSISVTVEPSKTGCLPGDIVPILIRVNHIKVIQSLRGVIVTFYRQARVDMHPNLPVVSNSRGREGKYEDYYPRSKTGLGGLSLTAAGSSQVWRKDLTQSISPLYTDAHTMSAEVKLAVRVPDDAFPTIDNVPGDMMSFKYFIEVIIDIHGKLGTSERGFQNQSSSNPQPSYPNTPRGPGTESADYVGYVAENDCVDTSGIRREKNAVVVQCDLLVGTKDSVKSRGKRRAGPYDVADRAIVVTNVENTMYTVPDAALQSNAAGWDENGAYYDPAEPNRHDFYDYDGTEYAYDPNEYYYPAYDPYYGYPEHADDGSTVLPDDRYGTYSRSHPSVPLPDPNADIGASEKERLRRAEESLLPSRPPGAETSVEGSGATAPTAPELPEEADLHAHPPNQARLNTDGTSVNGTGSPSRFVIESGTYQDQASHNASEREVGGISDKLELDRRRLQVQASAPPESGPQSQNAGPSAPSAETVDDAEFSHTALQAANGNTANDYEALNPPSGYLPRYER